MIELTFMPIRGHDFSTPCKIITVPMFYRREAVDAQASRGLVLIGERLLPSGRRQVA